MPDTTAPRWPDPVKGKQAEIDSRLWTDYTDWKRAADDAAEIAAQYEKLIREQAGDAAVLTVNGTRVAVRVVQDVTGASWRKDFYRRTPASR